MAQTYRLVGSQDPANRIDRWEVESPSEDFPDGKILTLNGPAVELSDEQYNIGARFLHLEPVPADQFAEFNFVDQPGVERESLSTDVPPDPGTAPDVDSMSKQQLVSELERVRRTDPNAASGVEATANKEDLAKALRSYHGQEA
jgi:hypothetical protein